MQDRLIVTVDQKSEYEHSTPIAVWKAEAEETLKKDSEGEWNAGEHAKLLVDEYTPHEFKNQYGLEVPPTGAMRVLIASYSWEEEAA